MKNLKRFDNINEGETPEFKKLYKKAEAEAFAKLGGKPKNFKWLGDISTDQGENQGIGEYQDIKGTDLVVMTRIYLSWTKAQNKIKVRIHFGVNDNKNSKNIKELSGHSFDVVI